MEQISLDKLLKDEPSKPGLVELYQRTMLHRTNEAMNGLSNRLDALLVQAKESSVAQTKQQKTMAWLTFAIAAATIVYTATTIYSTKAAARAPDVRIIQTTGPVPESAAIHMGVDEKGSPALCVNGNAFDVPAPGDSELKERFPPSQIRSDGVPVLMPSLRCKS